MRFLSFCFKSVSEAFPCPQLGERETCQVLWTSLFTTSLGVCRNRPPLLFQGWLAVMTSKNNDSFLNIDAERWVSSFLKQKYSMQPACIIYHDIGQDRNILLNMPRLYPLPLLIQRGYPQRIRGQSWWHLSREQFIKLVFFTDEEWMIATWQKESRSKIFWGFPSKSLKLSACVTLDELLNILKCPFT